MSAQTTPITERQLDLITRAHCDAGGLIEPLLDLTPASPTKYLNTIVRDDLFNIYTFDTIRNC